MTWIANRRGWMKEYKGRKYAISCRQLGTAENKAESYQAANAWWTAKRQEIDAANAPVPRAPLPLEDIATAALAGRGKDLLGIARSLELDFIRERLQNLLALLPDAHRATAAELLTVAFALKWESVKAPLQNFVGHLPAAVRSPAEELVHIADAGGEPDAAFIEQTIRREVEPLLGSLAASGEPLPNSLAGQLPPARANQIADAVKAMRGESNTPAERTIKASVDRWMGTQKALVASGSLSPDHADLNRICLNHFAGFLGELADVKIIDAARVHDFYLWCLQRIEARRKDKDRKAGWSIDYAKKVFATARTFVRFLWESGSIELPRNVNSRFRFNGGTKSIKTWTVGEVKRVIGEAPGQLKLHLLLMANCGFTQIDISDLLDAEVDWAKGTITRKRSKTEQHEDVPTVTYPLWPATWELLQKHRSGSETVLLTESGKPFVRKDQVNGKLKKADNIASNFAHLKRRLRFAKAMKLLRKTGATLLDQFDPSGRASTLYLGHSPRSIKDRHYARPDQLYFDSAMNWLGLQYGFVA